MLKIDSAETERYALRQAISRGDHLKPSGDVRAAMRARIEAEPRVRFAGLKEDSAYVYNFGNRYDGNRTVRVHRVLPSGKQADFSHITMREGLASEGDPVREYAGSWHGEFIELDISTLAEASVTHRRIVEEALLHVPAERFPVKVRREYPELFTEIPDCYATGEGIRQTAAERVKDCLLKGEPWGRGVTTPADVWKWIEEAHKRIGEVRCAETRARTQRPGFADQLTRMVEGYVEDLDFYAWLIPLVSPGGVFDSSVE